MPLQRVVFPLSLSKSHKKEDIHFLRQSNFFSKEWKKYIYVQKGKEWPNLQTKKGGRRDKGKRWRKAAAGNDDDGDDDDGDDDGDENGDDDDDGKYTKE